jgi:hypothetical protein
MPLLLLALMLLQIPEARAQLVYTSRAAFEAAVAGLGPVTLDFESETAGTSLPDPTTLGGITFSGYGTGTPDLMVDDAFEATSGDNYLGVDNPGTFNQFSYGDSFSMSFASRNAIGFNIITAEVPGLTLFDNDIRIDIPGIGTASLDADALESVTTGGDLIYFIGLYDPINTFTTAQLEGSGALGFYNIDDITTAVIPEPGTGWVIAALSPFLLVAWRVLRPAHCTRHRSVWR